MICDDVIRARRLTFPDQPYDCIELILKGADLSEGLLALEYRTCSPDDSQIQFKSCRPQMQRAVGSFADRGESI